MATMKTLNNYEIEDETARIAALKGTTTSGEGSAYVATVKGITALEPGVHFVMVPHVVSTTTAPTLNINGLGAKTIRRRLSNSTSSTVAGSTDNWLGANKPVNVTYDGVFWVVTDYVKPVASDLYGTLPDSCMPSSYSKLFPENMNSLTAYFNRPTSTLSNNDLFNLYSARQVFIKNYTEFGGHYIPAVVQGNYSVDTNTIDRVAISWIMPSPLSGNESESDLPLLSLPVLCGMSLRTSPWQNELKAIKYNGSYWEDFNVPTNKGSIDIRFRPWTL